MQSEIQPYSSAGLVPARRARRELASIDQRTSVELARIDARVEVDSAKLDAVAQIGKRAMQDVALVTQVEQQLAQLVPLAHSRLQAIGDITAMASAEIVMDSARRFGRSR